MKTPIFYQVLFFLVLAIAMPFTANAGWGVDSGRANEQDVFDLHDDWTEVLKSVRKLRAAAGESTAEGRALQLFGVMDGKGKYTEAQLLEMQRKWVEENIDKVFLRIATNPAASCAEARQMLTYILGLERQLQLIDAGSNPMIFGSKLFEAVRQRCHEELLDECNMTGRFEQIIKWQSSEQKTFQMIQSGTDDEWAIAALKECANYELHYVSEGDINDEFKLHTLIDGRIPIKAIADSNSSASIGDLMLDLKVEGETNSDVNPFLQTVDCGAPPPTAMTCSPGGGVKRAAWARLLDLKMKYREYEIGINDTVTQSIKGENMLQLKFLPAMLSLTALVKTEIGSFPMPFIEAGGTAFHIAHKSNRVEEGKVLLNQTSTGVYPILFKFEIANANEEDGVKASDRTRFELIHKPKKKPFPPRPSKPRVPLKPKG